MSLEVRNIHFSYSDHEILKGISFEVQDGEFVSVLGSNGVGKTTLFKCILKLLIPQEGDILIDGESTRTMPSSVIAKKIAYIPQYHTPVFNFSVLDMVLMGTTAQISKFSVPKEEQLQLAWSALEELEITDLAEKSYTNISGGERQMVLIARALAQQANILVMDEPSANLDFGNRIRLMKTVKSLTKKGRTVIQSTHDPNQAHFYSNRVLAVHNGQVLKYGWPDDVVTSDIISTLYGIDVEVASVDRHVIYCVPKDLRRTNFPKPEENDDEM